MTLSASDCFLTVEGGSMSFSMTLETGEVPHGDGVDLAFKIFQFTELVPDMLRASVMVVALARLFKDALAGHV